MTSYVFDIETEAGNEETIRDLCKPFVKPPAPCECFDPSSVKLGRMKDQVKIDAKIEAAREAHEELVTNYAEKCIADERDYWQKIIANAAKNPALGKIVVIGVKSTGGKERFICGDEPDILSSWWASWEARMMEGCTFIGCNNFEFDLPFLRIRSWINNVPVPDSVRDNRWWHRCFADVRQEWLSGRRNTDCESNLNHIGKALGLGGKLPGDIAPQFGRYWREQRSVAEQYLRRDLDLTLSIARRLGIIRDKAA